ncbi:MAG: glycosyltransferase [Sphingobacteriia bacterium]|jgi:glycosyltransferase involved in cell wall biosynthesis
MKTIVNIITGGTPGLMKDAEILTEIIGKKFETKIQISRGRNFHQLFTRQLIALSDLITPKYRIFIFLENIPNVWLGLSSKIIFIPNQEWMRKNTLSQLAACNEIWCKSEYAKNIFSHFFDNCKYIGFISKDMYLTNVQKNYSSFIHIAGRSHLKGTEAILKLWKKHPEFPSLTIVSTNKNWKKDHPLPNVIFITHFIDSNQLKNEMNQNGIHLCISEAEGFGLYIAEALSCKSVIITTNAPPMNELVNDHTGVLVNTIGSEKHGFGERFYIDQKDLEEKVLSVLAFNEAKKAAIGEAARTSFLEKKSAFETALTTCLQEFTTA